MTEQTKGLLDAKALAKTRKGVRIVNCARGGLVVEADLKAAIESGHVAGAALDVFAVEPAKDNPLFALEQVICTPHLGASTNEAQEKVALQVAEQMSDYLLTGAVTNALNMPSLSAEDAKRLGPYMKLAELLGSFAGQLTETGVRRLKLEFEGEAAELNTKPLTQIALMGFLRPMLAEGVNMVNAPLVARERNIEVTETKHSRAGDYQTLLRFTVETDRRERSLAGTLFGGRKPRLVEVKGIAVEAELSPHMLYITNLDKPGFIGAVGKIFGDAGINIATFHLGRADAGGEAIALLGIDAAVPAELLAKVRALPNIRQATPLRF
jgi:D-3-phosphoglycerate dehydrogenase